MSLGVSNYEAVAKTWCKSDEAWFSEGTTRCRCCSWLTAPVELERASAISRVTVFFFMRMREVSVSVCLDEESRLQSSCSRWRTGHLAVQVGPLFVASVAVKWPRDDHRLCCGSAILSLMVEGGGRVGAVTEIEGHFAWIFHICRAQQVAS